MRQPSHRPPGWLLALLVLVAFAFQGTRGLWEPDEGRYTTTAVNMLDGGNWLVPTIDREHAHLTKPPLTYWAVAASIGLLGHHEWAARLPGALAFVGTGLLVFGLGRRFCPARPWLPAVVWSLSLAPVMGANIVSTDALLAFFETAAMYAFVEAWSRDGPARRRWLLGMWLGWGLAFMTKGPPGLLPLAAMVAFLAIHDRPRLRGLFAFPGLLVFAVVAFTWFALVVRQQPDRLGYFLGYEVYDRVFTAAHNRNSHWYGAFEVYVPVLVVGALPWWALALAAAGGPRAAWHRVRERVRARDRATLLLLYWFVVPLVVFCLARSRLYLYVLPLFVPLAIVLARSLATWPWLDDRRLAAIAVATAVVLLAVKGGTAYWPHDRDARRIAAAIGPVVERQRATEVAFVNMRPYYGITLYLRLPAEDVRIAEPHRPYSGFAESDDLCTEVAERENSLYATKRAGADAFLAAVARCGGPQPVEVGHFEADGREIALYMMRGQPAVPLAGEPD